MSSQWTWSEQHRDYYFVTTDAQGRHTYHWHKQMPAQPEQPELRDRVDSGSSHSLDPNVLQMPPPLPQEERLGIPGLIPGTPHRGWYESLDSSYRMRTGGEARTFFRVGKVFSMLHIEAASEDVAKRGDDNNSITVVKYGEHAFSGIRRFVIVEVRRGFVYACPITTYSDRGTLKPGCVPKEHAIIHFAGTQPILLDSEDGMTKEPIAVYPADPTLKMSHTSRIRFGKTYPIEWNVKVKDIGDVIDEDRSKLYSYWKQEHDQSPY